MCECERTCIFVPVCMFVWVCMCLHACVCKCVCICSCVCSCLYVSVHMCVSACVHVCVCAYKWERNSQSRFFLIFSIRSKFTFIEKWSNNMISSEKRIKTNDFLPFFFGLRPFLYSSFHVFFSFFLRLPFVSIWLQQFVKCWKEKQFQ